MSAPDREGTTGGATGGSGGAAGGGAGAGAGRFAAAWDSYVAGAPAPAGRWPGDEWGDATLWRAWFERLFEPFGVRQWQRAIEIGPGGGKYTERVLAAGPVTLAALDVSPAFQSVCAKRLAAPIAAGRLRQRLIDERDPDAVAGAAAELGWLGQVDAVFSIDTLVHLTTTQIAALLRSAVRALRPGGVFVGTFADATSQPGLGKLLADVDRVVRAGGDPATGCFHWTSPEILRGLAERCGYEVVLCDRDPRHGRDGHFVFRLAPPAS
jgi:SAM-dependent methyltransferase